MKSIVFAFCLLATPAAAAEIDFALLEPAPLAPAAFETLAPARAIEVHFAPAEDLERIDVALLGAARETIDIAVYAFTSTPVINALAEAGARGVKVRIYPRIVQFAAYPLMFLLGGFHGDLMMLFIFLPGIFGLIGYTVGEAMLYSEEFAGADLFRFAPLRSPGPLFYGARKAALLLTFLPVLVIWVLAILLLAGQPALLWQLVPAVLFSLVCGLIPPMTKGYLIFSQTEPTGAAIGKGCLIQILPMLAGLALGGVSAACWHYGWYVYFLPVLIAGYFVVRHLFRKAIEEQALAQE